MIAAAAAAPRPRALPIAMVTDVLTFPIAIAQTRVPCYSLDVSLAQSLEHSTQITKVKQIGTVPICTGF